MFLRLPEAVLSPFHSYRLSLVGEAISNLLLGFQPSRASLCSLGVGVSTFPQQQPQLPAPHPTWKRGLEVTWGWGFAGPGLPFKDQGLQQGPWARAEVSPGPNSRGRAH